MTVLPTVARHYDAWQTNRGDLSDIPLADDFESSGRWRASTAPRAANVCSGALR